MALSCPAPLDAKRVTAHHTKNGLGNVEAAWACISPSLGLAPNQEDYFSVES